MDVSGFFAVATLDPHLLESIVDCRGTSAEGHPYMFSLSIGLPGIATVILGTLVLLVIL